MTGETDDAVVRGEASAEQTRRTNPNRIVYFALRVLAANFKNTSLFSMVNIVVTIVRNFNYGLNRRSRELTIQVV